MNKYFKFFWKIIHFLQVLDIYVYRQTFFLRTGQNLDICQKIVQTLWSLHSSGAPVFLLTATKLSKLKTAQIPMEDDGREEFTRLAIPAPSPAPQRHNQWGHLQTALKTVRTRGETMTLYPHGGALTIPAPRGTRISQPRESGTIRGHAWGVTAISPRGRPAISAATTWRAISKNPYIPTAILEQH